MIDISINETPGALASRLNELRHVNEFVARVDNKTASRTATVFVDETKRGEFVHHLDVHTPRRTS